MSPNEEQFRAELDAYLREKFRGKTIATTPGPRMDHAVSPDEVSEAVLRYMREQNEVSYDGYHPIGYAHTLRAQGHPVPDEVPDWAVLECKGYDAKINPADPTRIEVSPIGMRWVWSGINVLPPDEPTTSTPAQEEHP